MHNQPPLDYTVATISLALSVQFTRRWCIFDSFSFIGAAMLSDIWNDEDGGAVSVVLCHGPSYNKI
jgi:hypothetical protein